MKIESTSEYGMFKKVKGNRPVSHVHTVNLIRSIERENLLAANPIIVNREMEVIDGQHRLEAAKEMGEPIYYVVSADARIDDVMLLNATTKTWGSGEYARSYAERGLNEYASLVGFCKRHDMSVSCSLDLLWGEDRAVNLGRKFKDGKFSSPRWAQAEREAEYAETLRPFMDYRVLKSKAFYRAVRTLFRREDIADLGPELLAKYQASKRKILVGGDIVSYMRQFEDTVNWHRKDGWSVRIY